MSFGASHWDELRGQGYAVVRGLVASALLARAQATAQHLAAIWPEGGWERSKNESWREIRDCQHPDYVAVV